nr:BA14K family protein [uncultured Cohaesibacter sp.]
MKLVYAVAMVSVLMGLALTAPQVIAAPPGPPPPPPGAWQQPGPPPPPGAWQPRPPRVQIFVPRPPRLFCNVPACAARYRSFRAWDCTYQPYHGPRRRCRL